MTQTLPSAAPVDLNAEVECSLWEDVLCARPALFRVFFRHDDDDDSRCTPELACDEHLAEVVAEADEFVWDCEHKPRMVYAATWRPL